MPTEDGEDIRFEVCCVVAWLGVLCNGANGRRPSPQDAAAIAIAYGTTMDKAMSDEVAARKKQTGG